MHRNCNTKFKGGMKKMKVTAYLAKFNKTLFFEDFYNFSWFITGQIGHREMQCRSWR